MLAGVGVLVVGGAGVAAVAGAMIPRDADVSVSLPPPAVSASTQVMAETFGDGTWMVGADIAPGIYRTVNEESGSCYWKRLSDTSGEASSIIAIDSVDSGQVVVTVAPTDVAFASRRCGTWVRIG